MDTASPSNFNDLLDTKFSALDKNSNRNDRQPGGTREKNAISSRHR
jgi:hypothetical protein